MSWRFLCLVGSGLFYVAGMVFFALGVMGGEAINLIISAVFFAVGAVLMGLFFQVKYWDRKRVSVDAHHNNHKFDPSLMR